MIDYMIDTNVPLRWIQNNSRQQAVARNALQTLTRRGDALFFAAQNHIEFWSVATRPASRGGLALTPAQADAKLKQFERTFQFLPDDPLILSVWRTLVLTNGITDTLVHDARLAATMLAYGVTHIQTFAG